MVTGMNQFRSEPILTLVGDPAGPFIEEIVVDENTGELVIVYAPTLEALDELADRLLAA